ncbi:Flagellar transcriptional activator FlhC [Caballeronia sordidicola]|uniref:Flagellar transcriptional activator FlhC n=1 Tax=Caballeronia sordidicola TaxID=196367 RepID=A0A242MWZ5_CABSO|nr:Flagellar transcriptional activator FlhC [Caballeronia sordidicola]
MTKGYRLYLDHCSHGDVEAVLDLTRAWTLVHLPANFAADPFG